VNLLTFPELLDLLGHDGHLSLCTQVPGGQFSSWVVIAANARAWIIPTDRDAWFGVNPIYGPARKHAGRGTVADVIRLAALYADLDAKEGGLRDFNTAHTVVNMLSEILHTRPTAVTLSGNGLQPYWPIEDHISGVEAMALLRRFGRLVRHVAKLHNGAVDSVYDLTRILRVPSSVNHKREPKPVITLHEGGRPLTVAEVDEALTAYNVVETPEDRQETGNLVKATNEWGWADRTCRYTAAMTTGWSTEHPDARHPWLVSQATRLAAAHRLGCITNTDHAAAVHTLAQRFLQLLSTGPDKRAESVGEIADAIAWGEQKITCKTDTQAQDELGHHMHDDAVMELATASGATVGPPRLTALPGGRQTTNGANALAPEPEPPAATTTLERSEDGHAEQLIATHGHHIRYCPERGQWLTWSGSRWAWEPASGGLVREHAKEVARNFRANDQAGTAHKRRSLSSNGISGCLKTAQTDQRVAVSVLHFDSDPYALNTPAGSVDLRTGTLHPATPDAMHTRSTAVAPDPEQPTPRWSAFLHDTFEGSPSLQAFVQRLAGYSATGTVTHHILPFLHGPGGNGKSVLLDVLRAVLGDYAATTPAKFLMAGQPQHETEIARLSGLRMVICSEINQSDKFDEAKVKLLTGGDALTARFMRQDHFTFEPTHHLWLMGNHQPKVTAGGESFWRRLRMLKFVNIVPDSRKIDDLAAILIHEEGPGILHWIIEGAEEALATGLKAPSEVLVATRTYAEEEDTLARFLADRCHLGGAPQVKTPTATLRGEYEKWCQQEGETALNPQVFGREMSARFGIEQTRSNGRRFYIGITLLTDDDTDPATEWFK
jgi:P4 family phage/plasmid primase-like protien